MPDDRNAPKPGSDPTTLVGLVYRVLDQPHRTLSLIAILSLLLGATVELLGAQPIAGLHPSAWAVIISGSSITPSAIRTVPRAIAWLRSRPRGVLSRRDPQS